MIEGVRALDEAMKILMATMNGLGSDAEQLCQRHFNFVMAENKSRDWDNKSALYAQTRLRGYGLTANWYEVKWYGKKATKTRRMVKTLIRKPVNGHSYTTATLAKYIQPWEADMVREVEAELTEIRRKASALSKALLYLKKFESLESE